MNERPEWFGPKTYGYGSGLPIRWQGWLLLLGFGLIVVLGAIFIARRTCSACTSSRRPTS